MAASVGRPSSRATQDAGAETPPPPPPPLALDAANLRLLLANKQDVAALVDVERLLSEHHRSAEAMTPDGGLGSPLSLDASEGQPPTVLRGLLLRFKFAAAYHLRFAGGAAPPAKAGGPPQISMGAPSADADRPLHIPIASVSGKSSLEEEAWEAEGEEEVWHLQAWMDQRGEALPLSQAAGAAWRKAAALRWHAQHGARPLQEQLQHVPQLLAELRQERCVREMARRMGAAGEAAAEGHTATTPAPQQASPRSPGGHASHPSLVWVPQQDERRPESEDVTACLAARLNRFNGHGMPAGELAGECTPQPLPPAAAATPGRDGGPSLGHLPGGSGSAAVAPAKGVERARTVFAVQGGLRIKTRLGQAATGGEQQEDLPPTRPVSPLVLRTAEGAGAAAAGGLGVGVPTPAQLPLHPAVATAAQAASPDLTVQLLLQQTSLLQQQLAQHQRAAAAAVAHYNRHSALVPPGVSPLHVRGSAAGDPFHQPLGGQYTPVHASGSPFYSHAPPDVAMPPAPWGAPPAGPASPPWPQQPPAGWQPGSRDYSPARPSAAGGAYDFELPPHLCGGAFSSSPFAPTPTCPELERVTSLPPHLQRCEERGRAPAAAPPQHDSLSPHLQGEQGQWLDEGGGWPAPPHRYACSRSRSPVGRHQRSRSPVGWRTEAAPASAAAEPLNPGRFRAAFVGEAWWDPGVRLETECVQLLKSHAGPIPLHTLRLSVHVPKPFGEATDATLARFLKARPHMFRLRAAKRGGGGGGDPGGGSAVELVGGAGTWLLWKREVLQQLADRMPRALLQDLPLPPPGLPYMLRGRSVRELLRDQLGCEVWSLLGPKLRPFNLSPLMTPGVGGAPIMPLHCGPFRGTAESCRLEERCPLSHAHPRIWH